MAKKEELGRWRQDLRASFPVLGLWRRRLAMRRLARHRDEPDVVSLLVDALDHSDTHIPRAAREALADLHSQEAVDRLCALWAASRDDRLWEVVARRGYAPNGPPPVRILTALKRDDLVAADRPDVAEALAVRLGDPDEVVRRAAQRVLERVTPGPARDALCARAVREPDGPASRLCVRLDYRPSDREELCLFLVATGQHDAYFAEDFEFQDLRLAYDRTSPAVRERVLRVVRSGDRRYAGFLGGRKPLAECTEREATAALDSWIRHKDWARVLSGCLELPLRWSLDAWRALAGSGWAPKVAELGVLLEAIRRRLGKVGDSGDALGSSWEMAPIWTSCGQSERRMGPLMRHDSGAILHAAFSPDGTRLVTAGGDRTARVWDADTGAPLDLRVDYSDAVHIAAFDPDGTRIVTAGHAGAARLWDAATGAPLGVPMAHKRELTHVAFGPDGTRIVTASRDGTARLWDAATGAPLGLPMAHDERVSCAAFSPDGTRLVTAGGDRTVRVWDAATGAPLGPSMTLPGGVNYAEFSPDGKRIISAGYRMAQVWDAVTGAPLGPPMRHSGGVSRAAFSSDGSRVITVDQFNGAQIWNAATCELICRPLKHGTITYAEFSPEGMRVVTASQDCTARVWDAATGQPLGPPIDHQGAVWYAEFSPDGERIVTACTDGAARVWDAPADAFRLRPGLATPADLNAVAAALEAAADPRAAAALHLVGLVLAHRLTTPEFEAVVVEGHEFAAEFDLAD